MAYLVTDRNGRREFRWLEDGRRHSRRIPRGEEGDRLLAEIEAVHEGRAEAERAHRAGIGAVIAEANAMRRELEDFDVAVRQRLNGILEPPLAYDHVHGTIVRTDRMSSTKIKTAAKCPP